MKNIPIFSKDGNFIENLVTEYEFTPLEKRRVGKIDSFNNLYYKGSGIFYSSHNVKKPNSDYIILQENNPKYAGYTCRKKCFDKKYGIFLERFQPYFSDPIGGCGKKEDSLIKNSIEMNDLTNLKVKDRLLFSNFDTRIFLVEYSNCQSLSVENISFSGVDSLLQKIILSNWCCTWDKDIFNDLDSDCKIHDPADWFSSKDFIHLFGTLYCILYSLHFHIGFSFVSIMSQYKFPVSFSLYTIPMYIFFLIFKYNRNRLPNESLFSSKYTIETYRSLLRKYLLNGKYTCEIEYPIENESEKIEYRESLLKKYF